MKHNAAWATMIQEREGSCVVSINTKRYSAGRKFWIARITGKDRKYGIGREFVNGTSYGVKTLTPGIYDVCNIPRSGAADYERYFLKVYPTGEAREITKSDVMAELEQPEIQYTPVLSEAIPF